MRFALGFAFLVGLLSASAFAGEGSYVSQRGQWIVSKSETKIPDGGFVPTDAPIVVTQDDGQTLKFTVYAMTPTGFQPSILYEGAYDGVPYAYGKEGTRAFTRLSSNSFRMEWKSPDGASATELVTFNATATKMRAVGKRTEAGGKSYDYVLVWDRLP
jgi:hypothetical protein